MILNHAFGIKKAWSIFHRRVKMTFMIFNKPWTLVCYSNIFIFYNSIWSFLSALKPLLTQSPEFGMSRFWKQFSFLTVQLSNLAYYLSLIAGFTSNKDRANIFLRRQPKMWQILFAFWDFVKGFVDFFQTLHALQPFPMISTCEFGHWNFWTMKETRKEILLKLP